MQTQINPALAAAMTLERAAQVGQFQPMTPQGQPTVAAQLMQQAMPPSVPDVVQQAGLGAQIQAMQQQQAQQALMRQAMANRPPAGIEGLNPNIPGFKEGGIVGYAEAGEAKDKPLTERYQGMGLTDALRAMFSDLSSALPGVPDRYVDTSQRSQRLTVEREARGAPRDERQTRQAASREAAPGTSAAGVDSSDAALIAAITGANEQPAPSTRREPPPQSSLPQADYSTEGRNYPQLLSALERFSNVQPPSGGQRMAPEPAREGGVRDGASPGAGMFHAARARLGQQALGPINPREGIAGAIELGAAQDELRRQMGLPTEMERITKEGDEFRKLYGERGQRLAQRISQLEGERGQQGIINFLLGARGMRGQGLGETMRTGAESARAYEEQTRGRIEKMQDLQLEVRGLQLEKETALAKMKDDIANGRFKDAMANKQKAQDAQNGLLRAYAEIDLAQGKEMSADYREQLRLEASAKDRAEARKGREQSNLIAQLTSADAKVTAATQTIEKVLREKFPMAVVYNMNPAEAMRTDPEGVRAYLREEQRLRRQVLEPLERDRDNIRNQLSGFGGWGNLTVTPSNR